jgi:hypothetical protein
VRLVAHVRSLPSGLTRFARLLAGFISPVTRSVAVSMIEIVPVSRSARRHQGCANAAPVSTVARR